MKSVGAGFGDHGDLRARRASLVGISASGGDAELFNRVLGFAEHAGEGVATHLIVVVHAVEGDVALIGAAAVDRAGAAVVGGGGGQIEDAGLEREQIGHVAGLAGQGLDLRVIGGVAERGVAGVQRLRGGGDVHRDGAGLHAQGEVDGGRLVYQQLCGLGLLAESGRGDLNGVPGRSDLLKLVNAGPIACGLLRNPGGGSGDGHRCAGDEGAGRILDDAAE